jgi:hypothetical protein
MKNVLQNRPCERWENHKIVDCFEHLGWGPRGATAFSITTFSITTLGIILIIIILTLTFSITTPSTTINKTPHSA